MSLDKAEEKFVCSLCNKNKNIQECYNINFTLNNTETKLSICEKCKDKIDSDHFIVACPKCKKAGLLDRFRFSLKDKDGNIISLLNNENYICVMDPATCKSCKKEIH